MLWLAGLLGMMVVGSMAAILPADDTAEDASDAPGDESDATSLDLLDDANETTDTALGAQPVQSEPSIVGGGLQDDVLEGSGLTDLMNGQDGQDTLSGGANDDEMFGGAGDDLLRGGDDNDTLHGEAGDDLMQGDAGDDDLFGHDGNDTLDGGSGDDELQGGLGDDDLRGGDGDDALHGREGADVLDGGAGQDTLFGGDGDDQLDGTGDDATDFLNANDGNDRLNVGASDIATGGEGADQFVLDATDARSGASTLMDFDAAEDQLVILFDDTTGPAPEVTLIDSTDTPGMVEVQLDGQTVTTLPAATAPQVGAIALSRPKRHRRLTAETPFQNAESALYARIRHGAELSTGLAGRHPGLCHSSNL